MEVRLVLDPRLQIDEESFARRWRERPENLALGAFAVERSGPQTFGEPSTMLTLVSTVVGGVLTNALWEGVKWTYGRLCAQKGKPAEEVEFQQIKLPDGTEVTVLRLHK